MTPLRIENIGGILRCPGLTPAERLPGLDLIRQADIASIRRFMIEHREKLTGRVLDFGAGKPGTCREPQPHRDLVTGEYVPFDVGMDVPSGLFDVVMCNQVLEYLEDIPASITALHGWLKRGGLLVCTYKTNWEECEQTDIWRLTKAGMERILKDDGFEIVAHERRCEIAVGGFVMATGYGVVARSR